MKNALKSIVAYMLGLLARGVVHRYGPTIVMVTGSVGKTSTKDAVAAVLTTKFFVRKSDKSFNSELGVPFTIFGVANPWGNPFAWVSVLRSAIGLLVLPSHYPNMLVLEVGADRPGDLARILRIATPDAVVVTRLPDIPVHVEAYTCPAAVREEEFSPVFALHPAQPLIISADKPNALSMAKSTSARVISYGLAKNANVRVSNIDFNKNAEGVVDGMTADVALCDEMGVAVVHGSVGKIQLLPVVAAIATAHAFGISLRDALTALEGYEPPPGRGRIFTGKNNSILIDDTYNSSPVAVEEALETLKAFPHAKRRVAILGDMLELGRYSVQEHERIGALAGETADVVVTVGIRARALASTAGKAEVLQFDDAHKAAEVLVGYLQKGDVVLIKGSQSIRTERIVEALLDDRADVSKLVRQEKEWKRRG